MPAMNGLCRIVELDLGFLERYLRGKSTKNFASWVNRRATSRSTVSSVISSRRRRPAPTSVRDDAGRALSRSEAASRSGELRPRGSRDGFAPLARSSGAALDRAAELFLGQRETRSETDPSSNLPVRARARAATRPVFGADTPPLAQTVRMMRGPAEVDPSFNLEVERQAIVARAHAFLPPTMCPRPETRLSGSADALPTLAQARFVEAALNAWYARYRWLVEPVRLVLHVLQIDDRLQRALTTCITTPPRHPSRSRPRRATARGASRGSAGGGACRRARTRAGGSRRRP